MADGEFKEYTRLQALTVPRQHGTSSGPIRIPSVPRKSRLDGLYLLHHSVRSVGTGVANKQSII